MPCCALILRGEFSRALGRFAFGVIGHHVITAHHGATIHILDLSGALIDTARPESATTHFDLSSLPAGLYLVQVTVESGGHATRRVAVVD